MKAFTKTVLASAGLLACVVVSAQAYPERPITWIVPFSAGGPTDTMARDIAEKVGKQLGQAIVIENTPGAGGTIGTAKVARAKPDGYTLLVGHLGYMAAAPALYKKLAYDPVKDFEAVFRFPDTPMVMLVNKESPYKTPADLIAFAKANPGKVNFGNAGTGSTSHLIGSLFASRAGIRVEQVPYKGVAPAMNDLMGGSVGVVFDQTNTALPQLGASGRVKALGVTSPQPMPQFPGVQAIASAVPGFEAATWYGLYAPKGTPKEVVITLHKAYMKALANKDWTAKMTSQAIRLLPEADYAPAALAKHTAAEVQKWAKVAQEAKISID